MTTFARIAAFISDPKRRDTALDQARKAVEAYKATIAENAATIAEANTTLAQVAAAQEALKAHEADLAAREAKLADGQRMLTDATAALNEEHALNEERAKQLEMLAQDLAQRETAVQEGEEKTVAIAAREDTLRANETAYEERLAALHKTIGGILGGAKEG